MFCAAWTPVLTVLAYKLHGEVLNTLKALNLVLICKCFYKTGKQNVVLLFLN